MAEACQLLEWDTTFFGFRIARVAGDTLTPARAEQVDRWCAQNQIQCLYFLSRADDAPTARLADERAYRLMDVRLTFEAPCPAPRPAPRARPARPDDLPALKAIARASYRDTRFYFDPHFPRPLCDALYEQWIESSCAGRADLVWVAEQEGGPAGYVTCHYDRETQAGQIGLVGVDDRARGRGVGRALVEDALGWFGAQGAVSVSVVTQGRNLGAQRLYQRCGFLSAAIQLWYHKWFV